MNETLQNDSISQPRAVFLRSVPASVYVDLALILICVLAVFGRTLTSYFLADDFGEIRYLHRIVNGDFNLLVQKFHRQLHADSGNECISPFFCSCHY